MDAETEGMIGFGDGKDLREPICKRYHRAGMLHDIGIIAGIHSPDSTAPVVPKKWVRGLACRGFILL